MLLGLSFAVPLFGLLAEPVSVAVTRPLSLTPVT